MTTDKWYFPYLQQSPSWSIDYTKMQILLFLFLFLSCHYLCSPISDTFNKNFAGCQTCLNPLTSAPFGSPCACVFPMRIRLLIGVSVFVVFPEVTELEIEVAASTYLQQSQVAIIGASADDQDQEKAVVDINLIPLGKKFDITTATLTYQRFLQKKVPLNKSIFGDYAVLYINYPGKSDFLYSCNIIGYFTF